MIFLLGASGYVGSGFRRELAKAWLPHRAISRVDLDYTKFRPLLEALRQYRPELVILCGGYTGRPTLYHCEDHRTDAILGNVALAQTVAQACDAAGVRLGVVSCGCVFAGAWVQSEGGAWVMRENLQTEDLALFLASHSARVRGFADDDTPNATFEHAGSFYAGTLAAMEKTLLPFPETYIWRFNVAFTERDHPRNFLTRLQTSPQLLQRWNSFTHLRDAVTACLQIWNSDLPGGPYNVVNPGYMSTRDLVTLIRKLRHPGWDPAFSREDENEPLPGNGVHCSRPADSRRLASRCARSTSRSRTQFGIGTEVELVARTTRSPGARSAQEAAADAHVIGGFLCLDRSFGRGTRTTSCPGYRMRHKIAP